MFRRSTCLLLLIASAVSAQAPPAPYREVVAALDEFVRREVDDKKLPALSIALVDDQQTVWSAGYGHRAPGVKANAGTVYCVGSVSKLFTDLAVMRLAERGELNIDAPVTDYLPDFRPENPFGEAITLRHLMSHRAGLVREPPAGNYFDPTEPTLAATVASLNGTKLLYKPGTTFKYSNAGIATVGRVLEVRGGKPFAAVIRDDLLRPMGMRRAAFEPTPELTPDLARAVMWTGYGREFPAPTFRLGIAPAGSLLSDVDDMAKFLAVLFAGGRPVVTPETLATMYQPQAGRGGVGIGFFVGEFEGRRRVGHNGAVYGCATEFAALPDDKLGVVAVTSCDCANGVTKRVADEALRLMLAAKAGKPLPKIANPERLPSDDIRKLAGRRTSGAKAMDLIERDGRLTVLPKRGGMAVELKRLDATTLVVDDRLAYGQTLTSTADGLRLGADEYRRTPVAKPAACPDKWLGLIGEYGWDHNTLFVLEKDGRLHAQIEWFFLYPLTEESEGVYRFPNHGLYPDEKLVFTRDAKGKATKVVAAGVTFARRPLDGEDTTFRITPERPVAELRKAALAASPPQPRGEFAKSDLVELVTLDPSIKLDIRYASDNNFLGVPLYTTAKAFLQRPAAEAVARRHAALGKHGYGLLIHDGYRPWSVTKIFWDATPPKHHVFVADPATGSRHNRGCAVDLTLYDRATGEPVRMVGGYDEFSDRSYPHYPGGTSLQRWHRELLRGAMEAEGFTVYEAEWWHFDYRDWKKYAVGNARFEEIGRASGAAPK